MVLMVALTAGLYSCNGNGIEPQPKPSTDFDKMIGTWTLNSYTEKWVNIDGEGENVGTELHFVNHQQSLKIMKRDMKKPLISNSAADRLQAVKDQLQMTHDQLIPKKAK